METSIPKLYNAWFCPYAQRAWISFLVKKVQFEYIETDPTDRTPEWMSISPTGLVPVIIHEGNTIYESSVCVEYIDEAFNTDVLLMPKDPYKRAYARIWGDFLSKNVIPHLHGMLQKQTSAEQKEAKHKFLEGLQKFTSAMSEKHSFFQQDSLGYVDIMFATFAQRMFLLKHFRGFEIPKVPEFERYHKWWSVVQKHPAIVDTMFDEDKLIARWGKHLQKSVI